MQHPAAANNNTKNVILSWAFPVNKLFKIVELECASAQLVVVRTAYDSLCLCVLLTAAIKCQPQQITLTLTHSEGSTFVPTAVQAMRHLYVSPYLSTYTYIVVMWCCQQTIGPFTEDETVTNCQLGFSSQKRFLRNKAVLACRPPWFAIYILYIYETHLSPLADFRIVMFYIPHVTCLPAAWLIAYMWDSLSAGCG